MPQTPVRVAIENDYELVAAGVAGVLTPHREKVSVVEIASTEGHSAEVDVVLYDTFGHSVGPLVDLDKIAIDGTSKVVVFTWSSSQEVVEATLAQGVSGFVSKSVTGDELADAIYRVAQGEVVVLLPDRADDFGRWPGQSVGLSSREAEVMSFITQGMSNEEITRRLYISKNTLKSYIRSLYRKIEVERRSQAVRWGMLNGFEPDSSKRNM